MDAVIRENTEKIWPEVVGWNQRVARAWYPAKGSELAADDSAVPSLAISLLVRISLATASQHLMSVIQHLHHFGPTTLSLHSMLRTAIWGGAQAVWLLEDDDRDERAKRATQVEWYSRDNYRMWLNLFNEDTPASRSRQSWADAKDDAAGRLAALGAKPPKVDQTGVVRAVAKRVYAGRPGAGTESENVWRSLGAIAHALPWELDTRFAVDDEIGDGLTNRTITATWSDYAGSLQDAHEFTRHGWILLDRRGAAPVD
ncbi:hypothetical protein GCM10023146_02180 [Nocardioides caricicola]